MILDFLQSRGYTPKKVGPHQYESPCPLPGCGGTDRFVVWSEDNRAWCRRCLWNGDEIQLYRDVEGLEFKEAAERAGQGEKVKNIIKKGKDPFIHPELGKPDKLFWYTDEDGKNQVMFVARFEHGPDGKKTFRQGKPDGLTWALKGVKLVLYNLPELKDAKGVCFVEGEGKVQALQRLGIPATCNPMGSGKVIKQQEEFQILEPLRGKKVYIFPDNDEPGRKQADELCRLLQGIASIIKIVDLPGLMTGGDVIDYLKANESEGDEWCARSIIGHVTIAPIWKPPSSFLDINELLEVTSSNHIPIMSGGILPYGEHLLIAGAAGVGKSLLRSDLALHLAQGKDWLGFEIPKARKIAIFQYENSVYNEQKRLKRMMEGLRISRLPMGSIKFIDRIKRPNLSKVGDRQILERWVEEAEAEIVIYDCLSNIHAANENDNMKMREVLDILSDIDVKFNTTSILIHHFGKETEFERSGLQKIRGASSIHDWATTIMSFQHRPNKEHKPIFELRIHKLREGPLHKWNKPILMERDEHFICNVIEDLGPCPPAAIRMILDEDFKGEASSGELVRFICKYAGCVNRTAYRYIDEAVEVKEIFKSGQGRSVCYSTSINVLNR